jgi:hypothetical protein
MSPGPGTGTDTGAGMGPGISQGAAAQGGGWTGMSTEAS